MSIPTISENLFERLCSQRGVKCVRIPLSTLKTADYRVSLDSFELIAEIKQLNSNSEDKKLARVWGTINCPPVIAPSDRVQGLLDAGYPQVKRSSGGVLPTMIVVYNNSGQWNSIDTFTIAKAMFGSFAFFLELQPGQAIDVVGHGYDGGRKVTRDTFRSLSVVGVLTRLGEDIHGLDCYHNPFAAVRVDPMQLSAIASDQYVHANPHAKGFVQWAPTRIET